MHPKVYVQKAVKKNTTKKKISVPVLIVDKTVEKRKLTRKAKRKEVYPRGLQYPEPS